MVRVDMIGDVDSSIVSLLDGAREFQDDVELRINSRGGLTSNAKPILRAIKQLVNDQLSVRGNVIGEASSSAFIILQACSVREMAATAKLMFHPPTKVGKKGLRSLAEQKVREFNVHSPEYILFIHELSLRSKQKPQQLKEWGLEERIFDAQNSLEYGFVDRIVLTDALNGGQRAAHS